MGQGLYKVDVSEVRDCEREYEEPLVIKARGRSERDAELAEMWRKKGYTEERIRDLLGE